MVRIDSVWDSTTAVLAGRGAALVPIALVAFFLPTAAQAAVEAYGGESRGVAAVAAIVTLLGLIASAWGQLTIIGAANDPATTLPVARAQATRRLPAALLVMLVMVAVAILAALPIVAALAANGVDFQAAARAGGAAAAKLPPGVGLFVFFYALLILAAGLWLYARLFPLLPVVLHERRGIGAFGRALRLTRGMTWRLIGVALLFAVVVTVASWAAQAMVGLAARLLLGAEHIATATFLGALAAAVVAAAFSTVMPVFAARLYAALRDRETAAAA